MSYQKKSMVLTLPHVYHRHISCMDMETKGPVVQRTPPPPGSVDLFEDADFILICLDTSLLLSPVLRMVNISFDDVQTI